MDRISRIPRIGPRFKSLCLSILPVHPIQNQPKRFRMTHAITHPEPGKGFFERVGLLHADGRPASGALQRWVKNYLITEHTHGSILSGRQQATLQQSTHVATPSGDQHHVGRVLSHPVDYAVRLEEDLPVLLDAEGL
jgi:hypothetical protein